MEHYTSIEQSKKLLELGLSPETADMFWRNAKRPNYIQCFVPAIIYQWYLDIDLDVDIPCWSVGALIELMPQTNKFHTRVDIEFNRIVFEPCDDDIIADETTYHYSDGRNLVEACYNMVIWLLENNRIYLNC